MNTAVSLVLLGSTLWSALGTDTGDELTRRGKPIKVDASPGVVFGLRWRQPVIRQGHYRTVIASFGRPAVSHHSNTVIVGQGEGEVRALRLLDGKVVWRYQQTAPFEAAITLVTATVDLPEEATVGEPYGRKRTNRRVEIALAAGRDGKLRALETRTGALLWTADIGADSRAPATQVGGVLLITTVANKLYALDAATGATRWSAGRPAPSSLSVEGHARAVAFDGVVYAAFSDGYVEAYRADNGERLWSRPLSFSGAEFVDADADPFVAEGRVYVASYSDGIYALELSDGKTVWNRKAPAVTSIARFDHADGDRLIAGSSDGYVWGLARLDGELIYRTRLPPGPVSRIVVKKDVVAMTAGPSGLVVIDARSGKPLQATAGVASLASDLVWEGDHLAAMSEGGYLYLFEFGAPGMVQ